MRPMIASTTWGLTVGDLARIGMLIPTRGDPLLNGCAVDTMSGDNAVFLELHGARAGDAEALGRVLESCRDYLLIVAERGLDADLAAKGGASDLVQETLLGAYRDIAAFHGRTRAELLAWLRKILRNNLADLRRRYRGTRKRRIALERPDRRLLAGRHPRGAALRFADARGPGCPAGAGRGPDGRPGAHPAALSPGRRVAPVRPAHLRGDRPPAGPIGRVGPQALVPGLDPPR